MGSHHPEAVSHPHGWLESTIQEEVTLKCHFQLLPHRQFRKTEKMKVVLEEGRKSG